MNKWLGLIISLLLAGSSFADLGPAWSKTYGAGGFDDGHSLIQLNDGGYVIAGSINDHAQDIYIVRTDANGDSLWTRSFDLGGIDRAEAVIQTMDGGLAITGSTSGPGQAFEAFIYRLDANGDSLWFRYYGGALSEDGQDLIELADGSFVMGGNTYSFGQGTGDFWLLKVSSSGDSLWSRTFGGTSQDQLFAIDLAPDGGFILGGSNESIGAGGSDLWLVKTDSNGMEEWSSLFGGTGLDWGYDAITTSDGNYVIIGRTLSFGFQDYYIVKVDPNGNEIWSEAYNGGAIEWPRGVAETADGGFIICGNTNFGGAGGDDVWLLQLDAFGQEINSGRAGGSVDDDAYEVIQNSDGDFVFAGLTYSYGAGQSDLWLVKMADNALNNSPADFSRLTPVDGSSTSAFSIEFTWEEAEDVDLDTVRYLFNVWTPTFTTPEPASVETTATSITIQIPDPPDGTPAGPHDYFWTVLATDGIDTIAALNGQGMFTFDYAGPNAPPGAFERVYPADDSVVTSHNLTLNWTPAIDPNGDIVEYTVNINCPTHFSVPSTVTTQDTFVNVVIPAPAPQGLHDFTWTVTATDGEFTIAPDNGSGAFRFLENDPPTAFERVSPEDGTVFTDNEITLTWSRSTDPEGFQIDYVVNISSETFTTPIPSTVVFQDTFLTITIPAPEPGTPSGIHTYTWTVVANDGWDTVPATNGAGTFQYDYTAPNQPPGDILRLSPFDCTLITDNEVTLIWSTAIDPDGDDIQYYYEVGTTTFTTPVPASGMTSDTFAVITIPAPPDTTPSGIYDYWWNVIATDGVDTSYALNGQGIFFYQYMMPNEPPGSFSRIYPLHDELISEHEITLTWSSSIDPDGDSITYSMNLMSETFPAPVPSFVVTGDTFAVITIPNPPEGTPSGIHEYLWTLYASDGNETVTADSGATIFRYQYLAPNRPPGEFTRLTPADSTTDDFNGFCTWSTSHDLDGDNIVYLFHLDSDYPYLELPLDTTLADTTINVNIEIPDSPLDELYWFNWTVHATDGIDTVEAVNGMGAFGLNIILTAGELNAVADEFGLNIYPNPFNPATTIHYTLDQAGPVSITVMDILGRQVAELVNASMNPGSYALHWTAQNDNGMALPTGSYWVRLNTPARQALHRIVLIR